MKARFIPTRVGNTGTSHPARIRATVHPHACGEYFDFSSLLENNSGSSPRVWGIPLHLHLGLDTGRFIPTRVGNTF